MAIKNIPLTISQPGVGPFAQVIGFEAVANQGDSFRIPFRYPFADIANKTALDTAGFFRHGLLQYGASAGSRNSVTSSELNPVGDNGDVNAQLGYQLPNTEKLVLLVQLTGTVATHALSITLQGSEQYRIPDKVITFAVGTTAGIYEIPLFDFGLFLSVGTGAIDILVDSTTGANEELVKFALVARFA